MDKVHKVMREYKAGTLKSSSGEKEMPEKSEMMDEQKAVIAKKLQKNIALTRMERKLLAGYLLEDED